ncbi:MarR family winged helix-turn-helix transcriptional regulator [Pusillimonas sp.]|uniref:MarR family winged helix-turn-helix transcriptional regulator n=1 Tax=Pusillimonas sp. TaxID=3040095 RepID=UPI0037C56306
MTRSQSITNIVKGQDRSKSLPDSLRLQLNCAHYISRVLNRLNLTLAEKLRDFDITVQHHRVLQILFSGDGITIGQLAQRMVVTLPVLSRILNQMQDRELIERRANPADARYTHIYMTSRGVKMYKTAAPLAHPIIDHAISDLSDEDVAQFLAFLQCIDRRINEA